MYKIFCFKIKSSCPGMKPRSAHLGPFPELIWFTDAVLLIPMESLRTDVDVSWSKCLPQLQALRRQTKRNMKTEQEENFVAYLNLFPSHHSQILICSIHKTVSEADASCLQLTHNALKLCKWLLSAQVKQSLLWFVEVQGCTAPFRCSEEDRQCEPTYVLQQSPKRLDSLSYFYYIFTFTLFSYL